jgi:glycosyltransferase involved in cell wall biosynthesis
MPTVSVGVPVYNGEAFVGQALESLACQDFVDFEVIICDNASTDGTAKICQQYARRDPRFKYFRNDVNIGSGPNYRRVFELSTGTFFKWLPHDDRCYPHFLSRCVAALRSSSESVALVYPQCEFIDEHGRVLGTAPDRIGSIHPRPHRRLLKALTGLSYCFPIDGLFRARYLSEVRLIPPLFYWDFTLLLEVSLLGHIVEIPEVLMQQRHHSQNSFGASGWNRNGKPRGQQRHVLRAWTDPTQAARACLLPVEEERCWEYLKSVHHVSVARGEKALCYVLIPPVFYGLRARKLLGRWKRSVGLPV